MRRDLRFSVRSCLRFIAFPAQNRYQFAVKAPTKPRWTGVGRGGLGQPKHFLHIPPLSWGSPRAAIVCVPSWCVPAGDVAQQQPVRARALLPTWRRIEPDSAREPADDESRRVTARAVLCVRGCFYEKRPTTHTHHPAALLGLAKFAFLGQDKSVAICFLRSADAF